MFFCVCERQKTKSTKGKSQFMALPLRLTFKCKKLNSNTSYEQQRTRIFHLHILQNYSHKMDLDSDNLLTYRSLQKYIFKVFSQETSDCRRRLIALIQWSSEIRAKIFVQSQYLNIHFVMYKLLIHFSDRSCCWRH